MLVKLQIGDSHVWVNNNRVLTVESGHIVGTTKIHLNDNTELVVEGHPHDIVAVLNDSGKAMKK